MAASKPMQLDVVGLGRLGANIVRRLIRDGHTCGVFAVASEAVSALEKEGATGACAVSDLVPKLVNPRAAWVMVPAGGVTDTTLGERAAHMEHGDRIIDGGHSYDRDDIRRATSLSGRGIQLVDGGTGGGVWGIERGYCLMIGGAAEVVDHLPPLFASIAPGVDAGTWTPGASGNPIRPSTASCTVAPTALGIL